MVTADTYTEGLYDLHRAKEDAGYCNMSSSFPKRQPGTVCTVQTHCGFSNGHKEINISNYV